jgi:prepilin-type N-terminal cleavage/methylation domain-containing protein
MTERTRGQGGFTLIELLVVLSVVAILAAVAIPQYAGRQGKAYDSRVMTDARSAAAGQEAYFVDNMTYSSDCTTLPGYTPSEGMNITECTGDGAGFRISLTHPQATKTCSWDSAANPQLDCVVK